MTAENTARTLVVAQRIFGDITIGMPELLRSPLIPAGVCIDDRIEKVPDKVLINDASYVPVPMSATVAEAITVEEESVIFNDTVSNPDDRKFEYTSLLRITDFTPATAGGIVDRMEREGEGIEARIVAMNGLLRTG